MSPRRLRLTHDAPLPARQPPASRARRWRKWLKRLAWMGLGLLLVLLTIFLLVPVWISNDQGRAYILQQLNKHSRATISVDQWSLSWFHGTDLRNLTITLPDHTRLLSCPHVHTDLTLWGILFGHYDLGSTTIDTLQLALTKYPDGTTSLDALAPSIAPAATTSGAATPPRAGSARLLSDLRFVRGSLRIDNAVVTLNSVAAGESVTFTDVKAALTIAAPDAPFHLQVTAAGPNTSMSFNGTLPAPASWPPPPWSLLGDAELSAANLPTGLAADWLGLDPRWQASVGHTLDLLSFTNHPGAGNTSTPRLTVRGSPGPGEIPGCSIDARCSLETTTQGALLSLPDDENAATPRVRASLNLSPPLVALLTRVNPIFAEAQSSDGPIDVALMNFSMDSSAPQNARAAARLVFPTLHFARSGLMARLLHITGSTETSPTLTAEVSPLRLHLAAGALSYESLSLLVAGHLRLSFGGSVDADGALHLRAILPLASPDALASGTVETPIIGTTAHPVLVPIP